MTDPQRETLVLVAAHGGPEPVRYYNCGQEFGWWLGDRKVHGGIYGALHRHNWIHEVRTEVVEVTVRRRGKRVPHPGRVTFFEITDAGREAIGPTPMCQYADAGLGCVGEHGHEGQHRMGRITSV